RHDVVELLRLADEGVQPGLRGVGGQVVGHLPEGGQRARLTRLRPNEGGKRARLKPPLDQRRVQDGALLRGHLFRLGQRLDRGDRLRERRARAARRDVVVEREQGRDDGGVVVDQRQRRDLTVRELTQLGQCGQAGQRGGKVRLGGGRVGRVDLSGQRPDRGGVRLRHRVLVRQLAEDGL